MDIFIIYVIKTLLLPLSSLLILSITGLFLLQQRNFAVTLISFSLVLLLLLSLPVTVKYLAGMQEKYPPFEITSLENFAAQAIVVLGGGLRDSAPEYAQQVTLKSRTLARIRYAALLAKKINLPLLVSGGKVFNTSLISEADIMASVLNNEFNQAVRWKEQNSRNTAENALYTQEILSQEGITRIILVTHALHMHRAVEQFQQQGLQVMPAPTVFFSKPRSLNLLSFLPYARDLERNSLVIHEIMGSAWYKLRY